MGLLVVATVVRSTDLSGWWLNPDEGIYYSILTRADFGGFWEEVTANAHPPLYYLLLRGLGLFTWDFLWLRAFSVLCGVAAVAAMWAAGRKLAGGGLPGEVAGLTAGLVLALAPGAVELSQVMRPYMLQLALLSWALVFFLRYGDSGAPGDLAAHVSLLSLALLTHYSSALALGVFLGGVALGALETYGEESVPEIDRAGGRRPWLAGRWRRRAAGYAVPLVVLLALYVFHMRPLATSDLADEALGGWLSFYMIRSPEDVWRSFLGFQHLVATPWFRGPSALLLLTALVLAGTRRHRRLVVLTGGSLLVAVVGAAAGLYPFGSTRHSAWLLVFAVPALGWLASWLLDADTIRERSLRLALPLLLLLLGGPVGDGLGATRVPWAPTDRVLRQDDLARMIDVLDPGSEPELLVMSAQTFYLLVPFYPVQREAATFSADSAAFHFPYGARRILVGSAWDFTVGGPPVSDTGQSRGFVSFLRSAARSFPILGLTRRDRATLLVGGWRPAFVDDVGTLPQVTPTRGTPGLQAFRVDAAALLRDR